MNKEKFPSGPIVEPSPGPTLDIEVAAADTEVIKSKPVKDKQRVNIKKINIYKHTNAKTEVKKRSFIF